MQQILTDTKINTLTHLRSGFTKGHLCPFTITINLFIYAFNKHLLSIFHILLIVIITVTQ